MSTYHREAETLLAAYMDALGRCLERKIKVHRNGNLLCLGDLRDALRSG